MHLFLFCVVHPMLSVSSTFAEIPWSHCFKNHGKKEILPRSTKVVALWWCQVDLHGWAEQGSWIIGSTFWHVLQLPRLHLLFSPSLTLLNFFGFTLAHFCPSAYQIMLWFCSFCLTNQVLVDSDIFLQIYCMGTCLGDPEIFDFAPRSSKHVLVKLLPNSDKE